MPQRGRRGLLYRPRYKQKMLYPSTNKNVPRYKHESTQVKTIPRGRGPCSNKKCTPLRAGTNKCSLLLPFINRFIFCHFLIDD